MKVWWKMVREIVFPVVNLKIISRKIDGKLHIDHGCKIYNTDFNQDCLGWSLWCDAAGEEVSLKCDLWFFRKFQKCIFEIIIMKMFDDRENHFDHRSGFWEGVWSSDLLHVISLTAKYGRKLVGQFQCLSWYTDLADFLLVPRFLLCKSRGNGLCCVGSGFAVQSVIADSSRS